MDSIRNRLRLAFAGALLIAASAGGSAAVSAATPPDSVLARLHALEAPCDKALDYVHQASSALPRSETGASAASAYRTKELIKRARAANAGCPGKLHGREQELLEQGALVDKNYWKSLLDMRVANEAVLSSLDIQANLILQAAGRPHGGTSFASVDRQLAGCRDNTALQRRVRDLCTWQLADNRQTEHGSAAPDPRSPCTGATGLADDAGRALRTDPESSYAKAHDGLEENKRCTVRKDVHDINQAYLLSWKGAADLLLDVPVRGDEDIARDPSDPTNASPFALSNHELRSCRDRGGYDRILGPDVSKHCGEQLATNDRLEKQFQNVEVPPSSLAQPDWKVLTTTPVDPAVYTVRPESQFDWTKPATGEAEKFSVELVRDGTVWRDPGSQNVRSTQQPWVLFGAIRSWPEFTAMFDPLAPPAPVTADFFKTKMLVVAVQRKPRQRCTLDPIAAYSVPGTTGVVVPALRIYYRYRCAGPSRVVAGQPNYAGEPAVTSILALPRNNNGSVTFLENGASITTVRI
jgi:hypothetical protein